MYRIHEKEDMILLEEKEVNTSILYNIFYKNPYTTIYVVYNGSTDKLLGVITLGDFRRNQLKGAELINKKFTRVEVGCEEEAIKVLKERPDILSIPIVDHNSSLIKEYITYNDNKTEYLVSLNIIREIIEESIFWNSHYKKVIFIVEEGFRDILLKEYPKSQIFSVSTFTIEMFSKQKDSYFCDFSFEGMKVREIFYKKYNLEYITWNYTNLKEAEKILQDRTKMYDKIGIVPTYRNLLYENIKHCSAIIYKLDLKQFSWNKEYNCYEYLGKLEEEIECIFSWFCFLENPYITVKNRKIPILALDYIKCKEYIVQKRAVEIDITYNIIPKLQEKGIYCIVFDLSKSDREQLLQTFSENITKRITWDREYINDEMLFELKNSTETIIKNGFIQNKDYSGKYINIIQNERYTVGNPKTFKHMLYLFGPCVIRGNYVEDKNSIGSILRKKININYYIKNCAFSWLGMNYSIRSNVYKTGDIILIFCNDRTIFTQNGIKVHSVIKAYQKVSDLQNHIYDTLLHCDKVVTKYIADEIYQLCIQEELLKENTLDIKEERKKLFGRDNTNNTIIPEELNEWITSIKKYKISNINKAGTIVMNCNPFTLGHRYLIEEARKKLDVLYIFVVEEDKSFFSFKDRFEMVKIGVSDLENVIVIPSGRYIISTETLPGYFEKEDHPNVKLDATDDLELFAQVIAKEFNISVRFVGEEPKDPFTEQYNREMERILPKFGISFYEIPRKKIRGGVEDEVISASLVRKCMKEKNYEKIKRLVLPDIYNYLKEHYFMIE